MAGEGRVVRYNFSRFHGHRDNNVKKHNITRRLEPREEHQCSKFLLPEKNPRRSWKREVGVGRERSYRPRFMRPHGCNGTLCETWGPNKRAFVLPLKKEEGGWNTQNGKRSLEQIESIVRVVQFCDLKAGPVLVLSADFVHLARSFPAQIFPNQLVLPSFIGFNYEFKRERINRVFTQDWLYRRWR